MSKTWVVADPHFGHVGVTRFTNFDGSKMRPWDDVEEMDKELIANWNDTVGDRDRVYLLGDVAMSKRGFMGAVPELKGRIVLVKGNHDIEKLSLYSQYFDDIRSYVVKKGYIMSHIPIHPASMSRWDLNIHGHLHNNKVMRFDMNTATEVVDERYVCVSVEQIDYRPKELTELLNERGIGNEPE